MKNPMKNYIKHKILILAATMAAMVSCDQEQEVEPIMDPNTKPIVTITRVDDHGDPVIEGDTLKFDITSDKMMQMGVDFTMVMTDESEASSADFEVIGDKATLVPYSTSVQLQVVVLADNFPETAETLGFEVGAFNLGQNFQLNPASDVEAVNVEVANVNHPDFLTVAFGWEDPDHASDFDMLINYEGSSWNFAASADNPEINMSISHTYPDPYDGTYQIGVDPYDVAKDVTPYTISVGYPDGTVEIFEGTFDQTKLDSYTADYYDDWGMYFYRLLTVEKSGTNYTVTHVNE